MFYSTLLPMGLYPHSSGNMTLQGVPAICLRSDGCELWDRFNLTHPRAVVAFCELAINGEGMESTVLWTQCFTSL